MIWKLGLGHRPHDGIDPFAGYVLAWLVLFCVLSVIKLAAIARDVFKAGRRLPAIATSLLLFQGGLIYFQSWMLMGV